MKREDYLSWDEAFMAIAILIGQRSKDPNTQVGACIVNEDKIVVGLGYNGFPKGCSDDEFPWRRHVPENASPEQRVTETKYAYVVHAEVNAILNSNQQSLKGCTMYVALFPCNECAKHIIQSGIGEVVYMSDKYAHLPEYKASRRMFNAAGVRLRQFIPTRHRQILIDFEAERAATQDTQEALVSQTSA